MDVVADGLAGALAAGEKVVLGAFGASGVDELLLQQHVELFPSHLRTGGALGGSPLGEISSEVAHADRDTARLRDVEGFHGVRPADKPKFDVLGVLNLGEAGSQHLLPRHS